MPTLRVVLPDGQLPFHLGTLHEYNLWRNEVAKAFSYAPRGEFFPYLEGAWVEKSGPLISLLELPDENGRLLHWGCEKLLDEFQEYGRLLPVCSQSSVWKIALKLAVFEYGDITI